ncbi:MAG: DUF3037 domain-containing protein [Acidobacteriota bacterium]|nr:DUF3037 domain-containing protein [Acidobacteriota bacterium]
MPAHKPFEFATIRVVPRVERGEFVNAGVILFCLSDKFLEARVRLDEARVEALWPGTDVEALREHLDAFPKICRGVAGAGPIAQLPVRERFQWLVAPRSTVLQISPVHSGLCESPETTLEDLFRSLVSGTVSDR